MSATLNTVRFEPAGSDYVAAARVNYWRSATSRRFIITVLVAMLVVAVASVVITRDASEPWERWAWPLGMAGAMAVWMALLTGLRLLILPRQVRRLVSQQKTLDRDIQASWSETGLKVTSSKAMTDLAWSDYYRWAFGRAAYLFYLNDRSYQFIPRRALRPEQDQDLRLMALSGIGRPGVARPKGRE